MKPLNERIKVEFDNIDLIIKEIEYSKEKEKKSNLEIYGIAALLHNFYSGIENILKQIFKEYKYKIPNDDSWHKTLLTESLNNKIISEKLKNDLGKYLTFRHYFIHSYTFMLKEELIKPLIDKVFNVYKIFKEEINKNI